jgi:ABC-2 type transport system ATP-binding protein
MLFVKNFVKRYSGIPVLTVDELHLMPGMFWVKGENGSGKTTFFKSLAGLLPYDGTIYFNDGINLKDNPIEFRKRVNYSEAEPLYPGFLTAKDLIHFIGKAKGATIHQQKILVDILGISSFYTNPCETYSSGMLKKLSLAMAFLGRPKIIILDEPLITLDEQSKTSLFQLMQQAQATHETIFLMSSHQALENMDIPLAGIYTITNKQLLPA